MTGTAACKVVALLLGVLCFTGHLTPNAFAADRKTPETPIVIPFHGPVMAKPGECQTGTGVKRPDIYQNIERFAILLEYQTYERDIESYPEYIQPQYIKNNIEETIRQKFKHCINFEEKERFVYPNDKNDPVFERPDTYSIYLDILHMPSNKFNKESWHFKKIEYRKNYTSFKDLAVRGTTRGHDWLWRSEKSSSTLKDTVDGFTKNLAYP